MTLIIIIIVCIIFMILFTSGKNFHLLALFLIIIFAFCLILIHGPLTYGACVYFIILLFECEANAIFYATASP